MRAAGAAHSLTPQAASGWSLWRGMVAVALSLLVLVILATAALLHTSDRLRAAQLEQVYSLDAAQNDVATLLGYYLDQETGLRGYLLDGQSFFLDPYRTANAAIPATEARLVRDLSAQPGASATLRSVEAAYGSWRLHYALPALAAVAAGHLGKAQAVAETGRGKGFFDELRARLDQLRLQLHRDQLGNEASINRLQGQLTGLLVGALAVLAGGLAAVALATRSMVIRPLDALTTSARAVAAGSLRAPVAMGGPSELRALGSDVDSMRYRLLDEVQRVRLAGEALVHDVPTVAALSEALRPRSDRLAGLAARGRVDPAEGVLAGDWYDLIAVDDGLALIVGDVSGHGPRSAVLALRLRSVITMVLARGGAPGEALGVGAPLMAEDAPEYFATVFVALFDPVADRLAYASAGHPPALLHRMGPPGSWSQLGPTGPLLSPILASARWPTRSERFGPGDSLLAYTDGVTDARNAAKEEYGTARLCRDLSRAALASPDEVLRLITTSVERFGGGSHSDDRTLVFCRHLLPTPTFHSYGDHEAGDAPLGLGWDADPGDEDAMSGERS